MIPPNENSVKQETHDKCFWDTYMSTFVLFLLDEKYEMRSSSKASYFEKSSHPIKAGIAVCSQHSDPLDVRNLNNFDATMACPS